MAAKTNKRKYGDDFYSKIGSIGGKIGTTGGFAANRELAREAGRRGGLKSRRGKAQSHENACVCDKPDQYGFLHTCWIHHDCTDGSCTHQDGED